MHEDLASLATRLQDLDSTQTVTEDLLSNMERDLLSNMEEKRAVPVAGGTGDMAASVQLPHSSAAAPMQQYRLLDSAQEPQWGGSSSAGAASAKRVDGSSGGAKGSPAPPPPNASPPTTKWLDLMSNRLTKTFPPTSPNQPKSPNTTPRKSEHTDLAPPRTISKSPSSSNTGTNGRSYNGIGLFTGHDRSARSLAEEDEASKPYLGSMWDIPAIVLTSGMVVLPSILAGSRVHAGLC